jgi:hypothetical protein
MAAVSSAARIEAARRIVAKIGSALLVSVETGRLRYDWLEGLAADVADLRGRGKDVILVSSGSIALGRRALRLPEGALSLEQSQAAAAVGQIRLAQAYETVLAPHGLTAAQVLVTLEDSEDRRRYLNSRRTLGMLIDLGAVPIVNENDTVATDEIREVEHLPDLRCAAALQLRKWRPRSTPHGPTRKRPAEANSAHPHRYRGSTATLDRSFSIPCISPTLYLSSRKEPDSRRSSARAGLAICSAPRWPGCRHWSRHPPPGFLPRRDIDSSDPRGKLRVAPAH